MARLSKKEKERRKRISEGLKAFHEEEKRKAARRSKSAKKAAATRKRQKEEAKKPKPTYHKPVKKPKKVKKPTPSKPPKKVKKPTPSKRKPSPPKPSPPTRKPKPEIPPPSVISQIPERQKKKVKRERKPRKVKEVTLIEDIPVKKESFEESAAREGDDTWKGPWKEGRPTAMESQYALAEIMRISEIVAEGISSEKVREANELDYPVNSWALTPVINSDGTVSGEVRFEIPKGIDYMAIVQDLQRLLPRTDVENLWITPVVDYVPRQADVEGGLDALSESPFEAVRGGAFIRTFSVKYDDRIGIKAVTGFAKAQEIADKIDPQQRFIRPTVVRIKIRWSERPPRSTYEIRRMAEKRAAAEAKRRFMEGEGFTPIN